MSVKHKLFTVGVAGVLGAAAFAKVGAVRFRQAKKRTTAEQWLRLLSGANGAVSASAAFKPAAGAPAEIIGRAGYALYPQREDSRGQ
ncbi:MAG: hypothetical protein FOGNACKC_00337 [Anaerolineae bacterium]|nr:hypothetical protein [Anaerolineae bacterium]